MMGSPRLNRLTLKLPTVVAGLLSCQQSSCSDDESGSTAYKPSLSNAARSSQAPEMAGRRSRSTQLTWREADWPVRSTAVQLNSSVVPYSSSPRLGSTAYVLDAHEKLRSTPAAELTTSPMWLSVSTLSASHRAEIESVLLSTHASPSSDPSPNSFTQTPFS
eukprot:3796034-Prymnesium_polylepis.2